MTRTRKRSRSRHGGVEVVRMPHEHRIIALKTIYRTAAQMAKNKAHWAGEPARKAKRILRHAKTRKHHKKVSEEEYFKE